MPPIKRTAKSPARERTPSKSMQRALFSKLDKDGSGFLELDEVHAALTETKNKAFTDAQVFELMDEADTNNDGRHRFR